jgi:hypothetical protein
MIRLSVTPLDLHVPAVVLAARHASIKHVKAEPTSSPRDLMESCLQQTGRHLVPPCTQQLSGAEEGKDGTPISDPL